MLRKRLLARTKALASFLALWLLAGVLILVQFWPQVPARWHEVALILAFGPPLYGLLEYLGHWALSPAHGRMLSARRFSPLRVLVALVVALAWLAIAGWFTASMLR